MADYVTKDSGERATFQSGMQRDSADNKPRFDLLLPLGVPYEEQMLTRWAKLMERGQKKYNSRNWEKASSQDELDRFRSSCLRHMMQWMNNENDEDHAAAVMFGILGYETTKWKMENKQQP